MGPIGKPHKKQRVRLLRLLKLGHDGLLLPQPAGSLAVGGSKPAGKADVQEAPQRGPHGAGPLKKPDLPSL